MTSKKQSLQDGALCLLLLLWALGLFLYGQEIAAATASALELCLFILLPSLFPFFVLSSLLISSGIVTRLSSRLERPMRALFNLPGTCAVPLLLGMIGGYPVGARTASDLYQQGLCSFEQAKRLLCFCNNAGPAFFISVIGAGFLHDAKLGVLLWLVHLLAAGVLSLFPLQKGLSKQKDAAITTVDAPASLLSAFLQAVTGAFSSFLNVCAFVLIFAVITRLSVTTSWFIRFCEALPGTAAFWQGIGVGILELTTGTSILSAAGLPRKRLLVSLSFLCGWGGISVQCQSVSLIRAAGLPCRPYLLAKLLQGVLAGALTLLLGI